ncbi:MAG: phosphonate metabolism protein/1,5-bisphosphokinase (PRPP-forming) PhnN [Neomegalonema sp.]|nr:phosphonate metabolism protein/1,5-bisphosphokinase (PRPP-forming) PhnN [Neomegalonema sp.]
MSLAAAPSARGTLFLVVGPSGVGKDSLIDSIRPRLPDLHVTRRTITRAADAGGEVHESVDADAFARLLASGAFALHWKANRTAYGIRHEELAGLAEGRDVLASVSRSLTPEDLAALKPYKLLYVTAPREVLAGRLAARGRESEAQIAERLDRAQLYPPTGSDVIVIDNGGTLQAASDRMLRVLSPRGVPEREA